ncbi:MAG: class I SAM-dependent methyltransferase [Puniceicoccales bacterium]|nr:class I SAM-dependent methyltransferase [Puniceicoccales bacterium]
MYPDSLENFWLARALATTGTATHEDALDQLRPAVQRLSDLFTVERPGNAFPDYAADPALLTAYGLFFFPQSFVRARIALDQPLRFRGWRPAARPDGVPVRILDLGSGTGPCGLAAALALRELAPDTPQILTALDHSPAALATLRQLAPTLPGPALAVETHATDLRCARTNALPPQDLILAGFAANELFGSDPEALRRWLATLRARLAPGGLLLVLEPALHDTATTLQNAADALAATGAFHHWAPGLSTVRSALTGEASRKFWNHEVRRWHAPASLEFLNRRLFRDISVLKFAYVALGTATPPPLPHLPSPMRLVSPLEPLKAHLICAVEDAQGTRLTLEIPARGFSKSEIKAIAASWERGDIFGVHEMQALGQKNYFRLPGTDALIPLYRFASASSSLQ